MWYPAKRTHLCCLAGGWPGQPVTHHDTPEERCFDRTASTRISDRSVGCATPTCENCEPEVSCGSIQRAGLLVTDPALPHRELDAELKAKFERDLEDRVRQSWKAYKLHFWFAYALVGASTACSIVAVALSVNAYHKKLLAIFAAIPAAIIALDRAWRPELRCRWHRQKAHRVMGLLSELRYENHSLKHVSQQGRMIDEEMDKIWPDMLSLSEGFASTAQVRQEAEKAHDAHRGQPHAG